MRRALPVLAVLRTGLALAAIPLAPFLYREHPAVLVLLRPTKEVLLFAGYAAHRGDVALATVVLAALPILLGGVWLFYALGREHGTDRDLPGLLGRLLPRKRVQPLRTAVERNGENVLFLGRLAAMPSSLLAAAAGASGVDVRRFLVVDTAGALTSLALMLGLGWVLDDAYESAGPWLTALGVAAIASVGVIIGRALSRGTAGRPGARASASR
ncbi:MAG TPA: VTT domain-containing protein [Acidimicrobiales bacterium]|nr:VTT domain-containing protein [Acidimicrobiales bacterium]